MNKILVVVDMQNDFIDGPLGTKEAEGIVPHVVYKMENWNGPIIFTQDMHTDNYLDTQEGERLPIRHCRYGTEGWNLHDDVLGAELSTLYRRYQKSTFGALDLASDIAEYAKSADDIGFRLDEIHLCGLCTDICVISNAMILKAFCPEVRIVVDAACCAGTTPENHEIALKAMRQCQIDIENWECE